MLKALEMPVLRERLRRLFYYSWALVVGIRDAVADVDYLVVFDERG